jgi:hypothetical protein
MDLVYLFTERLKLFGFPTEDVLHSTLGFVCHTGMIMKWMCGDQRNGMQ